MRVVVVCGNPKAQSRTLAAGLDVARVIAGPYLDGDIDQVDLINLGAGLLGWGDPAVRAAVELVAAADLVVFASPTFKASYTGLLKLFLDQFETSAGLRDVVAVPLMLGAGPTHFMAPDLLLKPVLVELGAVCPAPGLYLLAKQIEELGGRTPTLVDYEARWGAPLRALVRSH